MANPYHHAVSSMKKHGGEWKDYIEVHRWFDSTKHAYCDPRHRAILHSAFGIAVAEQVFGQAFARKSDGKLIPTRYIAEQHVLEDLGFIPTLEDWLGKLPLQPWMLKGPVKFSTEIKLTLEREGAVEQKG